MFYYINFLVQFCESGKRPSMNDLSLYEKIAPLAGNYPVKLHIQDARETIDAHWHEYLEILFFRTDGCTVWCASQRITPQRGDCVIVNCNQLHSITPHTSGDYYCLMVNPSFFADVSFKNILLQNLIVKDTRIQDCLDRIFCEKEEMRDGYDMEIKSLTYHLITYILRHHKTEQLSEHEALGRKHKTHIIGEVLQYISQNYHNPLSTAGLAEQFHLNEYYFCNLFKSQTGQSPIHYINRYRIDKAMVLLKNSSRNITEIASSVGFENPNYFSRTFRQYTGTTPRAYKKSGDSVTLSD